MSKIYPKWRESDTDIKCINFKIDKIISYPPAGNEVYEIISNNQHYFLKIEKSKMADFESEKNNITKLKNYYNKIPNIIDYGMINNKHYIILSKIEGYRLSDFINEENSIELYYKYGKELAKIHKIPYDKFNIVKQRIINDIVPDDRYPERDDYIKKTINYLKNNRPNFIFNTFIHGDFHYANILWENNNISGILDFEYSGRGFKEQDIAWALIPRNSQTFNHSINEIKSFLEGYKEINNYNYENFKWCFINSCVHFYLMNYNNKEYINKLKYLMENI